MWAKMSLEELVRRSDLIVVGTLVSLGPERSGRFDVGAIRVEEILFGREDRVEVGLLVPRPAPGLRSSTDLFYRVGQHGLWFLRRQPGSARDFYLADHPQRLQSVDKVAQVRALLGEARKP